MHSTAEHANAGLEGCSIHSGKTVHLHELLSLNCPAQYQGLSPIAQTARSHERGLETRKSPGSPKYVRMACSKVVDLLRSRLCLEPCSIIDTKGDPLTASIPQVVTRPGICHNGLAHPCAAEVAFH